MENTPPSPVQEHLKDYPVVISQVVDWGDMDAYQHVNNAVYFRYMENSRIEYMQRIGWFIAENPPRVRPILADAHLRFRRAVTFPDTLWIGARLLWISSDRFVLEHRMVSSRRGEVTTEGQGTIVSFDYEVQRKAPLPEEVRQRLEALEGKPLGSFSQQG